MGDSGREEVMAGIAAAEGLAIGPIARETAAAGRAREAGSSAEERAALEAAIDRARAEIERLIAGEDELAGEILEFQQALLEDEDLLAPILARVDQGTAAQDAWRAALEAEIAEYRTGDDEYMAARADDLADLEARVERALLGSGAANGAGPPPGAIVVAEELTPSRFLELDWSALAGAATGGGSRTSHVAILARARGVPLLVGLAGRLDAVASGTPAVLDAEAGRLVLSPSAATLEAARGRLATREKEARAAEAARDGPAVTPAGERVQILINLDDPAVLEGLSPEHCDGIGLTRSEFLFRDGRLPDEESQYRAYRRILLWAGGRPVTIRTLDAGGDKPIPGVTPEGETNPFLGVRGLRLSLAHEAVFRVQLRALARAAALGPLKVMVPMVTRPEEMARAREILASVAAELAETGIEHAVPPLGMMVEVPAAALTAGDFDADFYSIGSNDLVQYTTAAARDNPALAALADPASPAVLELIGRTVEAGRARGVEVSLCGDMASEPALVPLLLERGLRALSVAPAGIGRVKLAVRGGAAGP